MKSQTLAYSPGPLPKTVRCSQGKIHQVPQGWILVPPGDAALTLRIKKAGDHWLVQEKKGRRTFSLGIWAPEETVLAIRQKLETERAAPAYEKKLQAAARRRENEQVHYQQEFEDAVLAFLGFPEKHHSLAMALAKAVTVHATPVGSGTVARTKTLPLPKKAQAAVIAWMRHQTTGYDSMVIPRIKGRRREIRRMLAQRSTELLSIYRQGGDPDAKCPLARALKPKSAS